MTVTGNNLIVACLSNITGAQTVNSYGLMTPSYSNGWVSNQNVAFNSAYLLNRSTNFGVSFTLSATVNGTIMLGGSIKVPTGAVTSSPASLSHGGRLGGMKSGILAGGRF
jgi:hypothetical protein